MLKIQIKGAEKILKRMKSFKPSKQNSIFIKGFRDGMKITKKAVVKNIKSRRDTGAMSKGITVKRKKARGGVMLVLGSPKREILEKNNPKFKNGESYYPANQEFGTKNVKAQNAYSRGFTETVGAAKKATQSRIWAEIKKELAK